MEKKLTLLLLVVVVLFVNLTNATVRVQICPRESAKDYILGFRDKSALHRPGFVTEGDDRWLQMASDMIDENKCDYVALLFYASWCPFSRLVRPSFDLMSLLYSSVPHFAIEESSVKASTLSKYGVHGFPTIILMNSTMLVVYRGSRTLDSLVAFYTDVTGIETMDERWVERNRLVPHFHAEPENCPFPWARRSPENLLRQETYLTLATVFVLLRLLHLISPTMVVFVKFTWGRVSNMRLGNPLEHTVTMYLKEPCMSSNLQEGAMNARAWASKSLATVSIAESSSSSRSVSASQ
ncbi:5'-adenylylsulfate reductase-like 6 [Arabidopsis thaliana]|uniref:ATAPRL6 n=2 Tax=Arabidopsis TaxID=3701 RepID=A0A178UUQ3_ARATH|nr:Thioredoxin domain [Arabidopsis thaliana x Arabidopsis arenosa]OAO97746.1 ATAPRL6 [Arabidopsis thaliana]